MRGPYRRGETPEEGGEVRAILIPSKQVHLELDLSTGRVEAVRELRWVAGGGDVPEPGLGVRSLRLSAAGRLRSDCGGLQVTPEDGSTRLLSYVESGCDSAATPLWVRVPVLPAGASALRLSYGDG